MEGYEIKFKIYAECDEEAKRAESAIKGFISQHAIKGRAVTGNKIANAVNNWQSNPFVRNQIIKYFS